MREVCRFYFDFSQFMVGFAWDHAEDGIEVLVCMGFMSVSFNWRD